MAEDQLATRETWIATITTITNRVLDLAASMASALSLEKPTSQTTTPTKITLLQTTTKGACPSRTRPITKLMEVWYHQIIPITLATKITIPRTKLPTHRGATTQLRTPLTWATSWIWTLHNHWTIRACHLITMDIQEDSWVTQEAPITLTTHTMTEGSTIAVQASLWHKEAVWWTLREVLSFRAHLLEASVVWAPPTVEPDRQSTRLLMARASPTQCTERPTLTNFHLLEAATVEKTLTRVSRTRAARILLIIRIHDVLINSSGSIIILPDKYYNLRL